MFPYKGRWSETYDDTTRRGNLLRMVGFDRLPYNLGQGIWDNHRHGWIKMWRNRRKEFDQSRYEKRMSSMAMTIWKMIKILLQFPKMWSRLEKGCVTDLRMEKWGKIIGSSFRGKVGFCNREESNWKLPSGSPSFFLPYRVLLSPSISLFHLRFLSTLIWRACSNPPWQKPGFLAWTSVPVRRHRRWCPQGYCCWGRKQGKHRISRFG